MQLTRLASIFVCSSLISGCLFTEDFEESPADGVLLDSGVEDAMSSSDAGTNSDTEGDTDLPLDASDGEDGGADAADPYEDFAPIADIASRDECSLINSTVFINAQVEADFPPESEITSDSEFTVGDAPRAYAEDERQTFAITWANAVGDTVHIVAGTAVIDSGSTLIEYPAYHALRLSTGIEVADMTIEPLGGSMAIDTPLYRIRLLTSDGAQVCETIDDDTEGIVTECRAEEQINSFIDGQELGPLRRLEALPTLNDDDFVDLLSYVAVSDGGTTDHRLGAARLEYSLLGRLTLTPISFPEFGSFQDTPFFERLVLGVSDEANRAPYLLILKELGGALEPLVLTMNAARTQYTTYIDEWPLMPNLRAEEGRFAFVSSLDVTLITEFGSFLQPDTAVSDAAFGYVAVLEDGSLGFSRPGGWSDGTFRRWVPPAEIAEIWTLENLAYRQPPGDPIILARTVDEELMVIRWDLNRSLEVIPDAISGSQIDTIFDIKGRALLNHDGSAALKVARGQTPDIAIVNLTAVRDFSDALCP